MLNSKIGYMICETAASQPRESVIVEEKNGRVTIEAILQDMNIKNRNGRFYDDKELAPEIESARMRELIMSGNMTGEAGHPMSKDIGRQQTIDPMNVSHKILKLWRDGDDIKAHVKGTPNRIGEDFNNFVLDDTKVSFSLRALGSVENTKRGAEVKNIKIITWDWVFYPSHKRAYMTGMVNESAIGENGSKLMLQPNDSGILVPISNQSVLNYIKTESANIGTILNSFDTLYETATVIENGRKVQLVAKTGEIFVVNLESYIRDEIMDFAAKY